jgi:polar amino acid transport system substrate-binding protein
MSPRSLSRFSLLFVVLALAAVLAFAACKDDEKETDKTPSTGQTPAAIDISGVPELADGTLTAGSDIAYAPFEFYQEGTQTEDGLDVDIAKAIAEVLGVDIEWVNSPFDTIRDALNTSEFDVVISAMTITPERQQEVDFVPYLSVGTGILVPAGNPDGIQELADLCGHTVAVQLGTIQETMIDDQNAQCDQPIEKVTFDTNPLAVQDLRTGGADANLSDYPVALLDSQESEGDLEVVETQVAPEPYGIAVRKGSTELNGVLEEALQAIRDSGQYDDILTKWELGSTALP